MVKVWPLLASLHILLCGISCHNETQDANLDNPASSAKSLLQFTITGSLSATISDKVTVTMPYGTDVTALRPTILYTGARIDPQSGAAVDFTNPVYYTIFAEDSTTLEFEVIVYIAANPAKSITEFSFLTLDAAVTISEETHLIQVHVPFGTDLSHLSPNIIHTGQSISPASAVPTDFNSPVTYQVRAADSTTQDYLVTVLVAAPPYPVPLRILPLGDSQTAGFTNAPSWTVPFTFGYRGPLYSLLTNAGYQFQFVGTSDEPWSLPFGATRGLPVTIIGPDLRDVAQDKHCGYGGAWGSDILNGGSVFGSTSVIGSIETTLNTTNPDLILLMIGTNNLQEAISTIDSLINHITSAKPNARLVVAQIPPQALYQDLNPIYNQAIAVAVAKYAKLGRFVSLVNQNQNFLTDPQDPTSIKQSLISDDGVHLTVEANQLLAETWFAEIQRLR